MKADLKKSLFQIKWSYCLSKSVGYFCNMQINQAETWEKSIHDLTDTHAGVRAEKHSTAQ